MKKVDLKGLAHRVKSFARYLFELGNRSWHNRIVAIGWIAMSLFFPLWIYDIIYGTIHGAASLLLVALAGFGFFQLWKKREDLASLKAADEDRMLGYILIFAAIIAVPIIAKSFWLYRFNLSIIKYYLEINNVLIFTESGLCNQIIGK